MVHMILFVTQHSTTYPTGLTEGQYINIGLNYTALNDILVHCSTICQSHYYFHIPIPFCFLLSPSTVARPILGTGI